MKYAIKKIALLAIMLICVSAINAQGLKDIVSKVASAATSKSGSTVSSVVDNLIGTSKVSASSLVGTWKYTQPAIAFESESMLYAMGGAATSAKIEERLAASLSKVGITTGKFSITFAKDGTFTSVVNGKQIKGVYTVSGSTITFAKSTTAKSKINANVKLGTTLQITFKADKLLAFAKQFGALASTASSQLATITQLANNIKGMQVGMRFKK